MSEPSPGVAAIVVAGGAGSRMGGAHKPGLPLGGATLLERTVTALREVGCDPVVVVGPEVQGGPLAALDAGLRQVTTAGVMVWAADLAEPAAAIGTLVGVAARPDGAVLVDPRGREQWLAAVYRVEALRERLDVLRGENPSGTVDGLPMRALGAGLDLARVPAAAAAIADIDTWQDYEQAKERHDG